MFYYSRTQNYRSLVTKWRQQRYVVLVKRQEGGVPTYDSKYFSILPSCVRMLVFVAGHRSLEKAVPLPYATYTTPQRRRPLPNGLGNSYQPACLPAYPGRLPEDACSSRALASLGFYHVLAVMMTTTRILLLAVSSSAFRRLPLPQQHRGLPRLRQRAPRVRANGRGRGTATEGPTPSSYSRQNISSWNLVLTINNSDKSHDHLVKGQTVKVRKTSSFFLLLADILSDAIFQVIEQRGTSLLILIDKVLT